jgi:hypothetical protein
MVIGAAAVVRVDNEAPRRMAATITGGDPRTVTNEAEPAVQYMTRVGSRLFAKGKNNDIESVSFLGEIEGALRRRHGAYLGGRWSAQRFD